MRFKPMFAALLMLLPVPALADVTAHYAVGDKSLVIETEDGGNARLVVADKFTLIRRDGVDYVVTSDAKGANRVARVDELLAMVHAQMQGAHPPKSADGGPRMDFNLVPGDAETVAGFAGTVWKIGPAEAADAAKGPTPPGSMLDIVMSPDPKLAPVGGFLRHLIELVAPMMTQGFGDSNFVQRTGELFGKGTPIRFGPVKLASIETTDIPDDHFILPGPVLSAGEFLEAVDPSKAAQVLPPAP